MNEVVVKPLVSVDGIPFGAPRTDVRTACGKNFSEFKKSKFSKNTTDDYGTFHVFYDEEDSMVAVEFFDGATVLVGKSVVFPAAISDAAKVLRSLEGDDYGLTSVEESVSITLSEGHMDSIIFAKKGYFEA